MIKDKIENIGNYKLNDHFEKFKRTISEDNIPPTKLEAPLRVIPLEYGTKDFDLTKFENHNKNIDIHYVISGIEEIGVTPVEDLEPNMAYNEEGDYQLFDGHIQDRIVLNPGEFLLLFPGEAHVTGGKIDSPASVKKMVYKVPYTKELQ